MVDGIAHIPVDAVEEYRTTASWFEAIGLPSRPECAGKAHLTVGQSGVPCTLTEGARTDARTGPADHTSVAGRSRSPAALGPRPHKTRSAVGLKTTGALASAGVPGPQRAALRKIDEQEPRWTGIGIECPLWHQGPPGAVEVLDAGICSAWHLIAGDIAC